MRFLVLIVCGNSDSGLQLRFQAKRRRGSKSDLTDHPTRCILNSETLQLNFIKVELRVDRKKPDVQPSITRIEDHGSI